MADELDLGPLAGHGPGSAGWPARPVDPGIGVPQVERVDRPPGRPGSRPAATRAAPRATTDAGGGRASEGPATETRSRPGHRSA